MNKLINALVRDRIIFDNGKPQKEGSGSKLLDAFASLGACRQKTNAEILKYWMDAWAESPEGTLRMAMYNRDVRGGQGERRTFRIFWSWLCRTKPQIAIANIENVPFFGRWDDLWSNWDEMSDQVWEEVSSFIFGALVANDKLCSKWMPREGKKLDKVAKKFAETWGMNMEAYRRFISANNIAVERQMCQRLWDQINYNHVPSQASQRYRKAFLRRDEARYRKYLGDLIKGVKGVKVNAGAIYPHEVLRPILGLCAELRSHYFGYDRPTVEEEALCTAQWNALPNFVEEDENYIVVGDTSGSMGIMHGRTPIEVCVSLCLYLSERAKSVFKNCFITFSNNPTFHVFKGESIAERLASLDTTGWNQNTDLKSVFHLILNTAVRNHVPAKDMPSAVLIISDMQFNTGVGEGFTRNGAFAVIDGLYQAAGYKRPRVIFWNVNDIAAKPAKFDTNGTALVSGFSPSVMKSIFKGVNPLEVMINTLGNERYDRVVI